MNSTLYSQQNRLVPSNVLKFRCRIDGSDGQDVHRTFTGAYYPRWRALYLDEMRLVLGQYRVVPVFPFDVYVREDGSHFMTDNFDVGSSLFLGETKCARDKGAKRFVVTEVDATNLRTPTFSEVILSKLTKGLSPSAARALEKLRNAFAQRAGGSAELGIKDFGRRFRAVDVNGVRLASKVDLERSAADVHADLTLEDVNSIFECLETGQEGHALFEDMLNFIRGPMSERRRRAVANVFEKLDLDRDGRITIHEIKSKFNALDHPDVRRGELTPEQLTTAFLAVWDTRDKNGFVPYTEFSDYYSGVSASVDDDELFEAIVYSSWRVLM